MSRRVDLAVALVLGPAALKTWPFFWQQTEYALGRGTTDYLLLVLAADHVLNQ